MITYVKAKNFKSLKNIEFNLNRTKTKTNNFIAIYGENGSGKTNIIELFKFIKQSITARANETLIRGVENELFKESPEELKDLLSINTDVKEYRMVNEELPTEVEYGFKIDGKDGKYIIKFTDKIIEEKLFYVINKQKGYLFEISNNDNHIIKKLNSNIFTNKKYNEELLETIEKYWGKYSFLALLFEEVGDKNMKYVREGISDNLFGIMIELLSMIVHVNKDRLSGELSSNVVERNRLDNIQKGTANKEDIKTIQIYANILNIFFTQAYADIKEVKYKIEDLGQRIHYQLYFTKMIGGKIRSIPSKLESSGTQKILEQFDSIIGALLGETVIIDEIDNGIHDILMKNIILSIKDEITGQLIVTTHNTLLLEVLPKESIYVLTTDYEGNKKISSINDYDIRIQKNHNPRDLYLKGVFGGSPLTEYIDFEEIKYALEETIDKEEENY